MTGSPMAFQQISWAKKGISYDKDKTDIVKNNGWTFLDVRVNGSDVNHAQWPFRRERGEGGGVGARIK